MVKKIVDFCLTAALCLAVALPTEAADEAEPTENIDVPEENKMGDQPEVQRVPEEEVPRAAVPEVEEEDSSQPFVIMIVAALLILLGVGAWIIKRRRKRS